jgi:hypothetical protein
MITLTATISRPDVIFGTDKTGKEGTSRIERYNFEFPDSPEAAPTTHDLLLEIGSDA